MSNPAPFSTVLIVDDDPDVREQLRILISRKHSTITASNGADALEKIQKSAPRLIVSDINMPIMDGIELLKTVKKNPDTSSIPVILISAQTDEVIKQDALLSGAADYIIKPFPTPDFLNKVDFHYQLSGIRREMENDAQHLLMQVPSPLILLKAPDFTIAEINQAALQLWSKKTEEVKRKTLDQLFPELADEAITGILSAVHTDHQPAKISGAGIRVWNSGHFSTRYFDFSFNIYKSQKETVVGILVTFSDVTERIRVEKRAEEKNKRFSKILTDSPFAFASLEGPDLLISQANHHMLDIWSTDSEKAVGHSLFDILPGQTRFLKEKILPIYSTGLPFRENEVPVNRQESEHYYSYAWQPTLNDRDEIIGVTVIANDVTAQALANRKISENEKSVRNLFMQTPVGIAIYKGRELEIEMVNNTMLEYWGRSREACEGKLLWEVLPEAKAQGFDQIADRVFTSGEGFVSPETEMTLLRNGRMETIYASFAFEPRRDEKGNTIGLLGIANEVTRLIQSKKLIEEANLELIELANAMPHLVWRSDEFGVIKYYNDRIGEFAGASRNITGEWVWRGLVHPEDIEGTALIWKAAIENGTQYERQHRIQMADGSYRWFLSRGYPQKDESGRITKWFGTATDIDDQKSFTEQLNEKLKAGTQQLKEANASLEAKNRELQIQNDELASFTYVASHDLQEPLRKIQTFGSRILQLEEEKFAANTLDYFNRIMSASNRMQSLIDSLLNYSTISTSDRNLILTDLNPWLSDLLAEWKDHFEENQVKIEVSPLPEIEIIPKQLKQLFIQLISNAIKYRKSDKTVRLSVRAERVSETDVIHPENTAYWKISFSDNGMGFDQQYANRIFELFQRLHGKTEYSGTGIGLAICRKIMQNHNGFITATGELGKGASFHLFFPGK